MLLRPFENQGEGSLGHIPFKDAKRPDVGATSVARGLGPAIDARRATKVAPTTPPAAHTPVKPHLTRAPKPGPALTLNSGLPVIWRVEVE